MRSGRDWRMDDRFPDVLPGAYADEITPDAEVF